MPTNNIDSAMVIWITGLPGSGKTTLASGLKQHLVEKGLNVIHLDGDQLRAALNAEEILDLPGRKKLANSYQNLTRLLLAQGINVVVSTVSLFSNIFTSNRELFPKYFEIFLEADQDLLESGPRSIQYAEQKNVYTKDISPDFPENPSLTLYAHNSRAREKWLEIASSALDEVLKLND